MTSFTREPEPARERGHERAEAEVRAEPVAPRAPAVPPAPPAAIHAVSEHEAAGDEPHRPVRKRRHSLHAPQAEAPLQLVETQVEAAPPMEVENELPRRTRPRRRRSASVDNAPLMLVETQNTPGDQGDNLAP